MRRLGWKLFLAASLCLNAGFVSALVIHQIHHHRDHGIPGLKPSPAVQAQMEENFSAFKARLAVLNSELHAERAKLVALLATENPSPEAIQAQQMNILAANHRIVAAFTEHLLKQKSLLSPQEQHLFFDHVQHRNPESSHRPPSRPEENHP